MIEGAILYSSFAFLKSFQANGKNKIINVVRGIDFSVRDENLHCIGGAWLYNQFSAELGGVDDSVKERLVEAARRIYEHEYRIAQMVFEKGDIEGINLVDLEVFVKSRINLCLENLGIDPIYEVKKNPIADWFYDDINSIRFHDFFTGSGSEYNRNWDESAFKW
jgi:ribonucleotide reductase beta subunit family protein with ferritin-like domain